MAQPAKVAAGSTSASPVYSANRAAPEDFLLATMNSLRRNWPRGAGRQSHTAAFGYRMPSTRTLAGGFQYQNAHLGMRRLEVFRRLDSELFESALP